VKQPARGWEGHFPACPLLYINRRQISRRAFDRKSSYINEAALISYYRYYMVANYGQSLLEKERPMLQENNATARG
jgi:hypothetical protein